jgi:AmmeMemoRadiSam system protein B
MRKAVVAGRFYPKSKEKILNFFNSVDNLPVKKNAYGLIVPHAGYIFSGATAVRTFYSAELPDLIIILCPNHQGEGQLLGVSFDDWETPFGIMETDKEVASYIVKNSDAVEDFVAHKYEHSLEVQLPIVKWLNPNAKIVAVSVGTLNTVLMDSLVSAIAAIYNQNKCLVVASSDMSHFVSEQKAKRLDGMVIDKLTELDANNMFNIVMENNISMCGVAPSYIVTKVAKESGATKGEVIEYTNSGKVTGDYFDVVAYLGMRFI